MNKVLDFIERNAVKIVVTSLIMFALFFAWVYLYSIQRDIRYVQENIVSLINDQSTNQTEIAKTTFGGLLYIINKLEEVVAQQQFIIAQNREVNKPVVIKKDIQIIPIKPSYQELKSHEVWIEGCADGATLDENTGKKTQEDSKCWGGTGVVIKITDGETYILTNNHVTGKEGLDVAKDVTLYVENDEEKKLIKAEIIKQADFIDQAVIKIESILPEKAAITKISIAHIQDPVYVVGNPLAVRDIYSEGVVAGYEGMDLLVQIPCIFGNSGSGVFNSNGELVGLVYALEGYPGFAGIPMARITHSLVIDSVAIKVFLKDLGLYTEE
jgi:S1-C subfamily serine protease